MSAGKLSQEELWFAAVAGKVNWWSKRQHPELKGRGEAVAVEVQERYFALLERHATGRVMDEHARRQFKAACLAAATYPVLLERTGARSCHAAPLAPGRRRAAPVLRRARCTLPEPPPPPAVRPRARRALLPPLASPSRRQRRLRRGADRAGHGRRGVGDVQQRQHVHHVAEDHAAGAHAHGPGAAGAAGHCRRHVAQLRVRGGGLWGPALCRAQGWLWGGWSGEGGEGAVLC
jgi:hypothetical protein